jgi:hypothetical protein
MIQGDSESSFYHIYFAKMQSPALLMQINVFLFYIVITQYVIIEILINSFKEFVQVSLSCL